MKKVRRRPIDAAALQLIIGRKGACADHRLICCTIRACYRARMSAMACCSMTKLGMPIEPGATSYSSNTMTR